MKKKSYLLFYNLIGIFLLLLDQSLKFFSRNNPKYYFYIWKNLIGWEYLPNYGIAFSLPIPNLITIILTPLIILLLIYYFYKKKNKTNLFYLSSSFIIFGAISNYIDRILFSFTIDYFRFFTGVINLADVMIVLGGILLLFVSYKPKNKL